MKKVLVVDDEMAITEGLKALLEMSDIEAATAGDRLGAEEMLTNEFYPVVLADLRLHTEEEGLSLLESIRRISPASRVATLTAYATPEMEARLRELGSKAILHKPMPFDEILEVVNEMLEAIELEAVAHTNANGELDLDALYSDVRRVLFAIPQRKFGLTAEETEDLVQEAWLLFMQKRASIENSKPWLTGTIVNLCKQRIQRNTRTRGLMREIVEEDHETLHVESGSHVDSMVIQQALDRLDERGRRLCTLIAIEGHSYDEVSAELSIPLGSVGPLYIRAKSRLHKMLSAEN